MALARGGPGLWPGLAQADASSRPGPRGRVGPLAPVPAAHPLEPVADRAAHSPRGPTGGHLRTLRQRGAHGAAATRLPAPDPARPVHRARGAGQRPGGAGTRPLGPRAGRGGPQTGPARGRVPVRPAARGRTASRGGAFQGGGHHPVVRATEGAPVPLQPAGPVLRQHRGGTPAPGSLHPGPAGPHVRAGRGEHPHRGPGPALGAGRAGGGGCSRAWST